MLKALGLVTGLLVLGISCQSGDIFPWSEEPITSDEQVGGVTPDGTQCHSGTFACADGPEVTECGSWYFDMNEAGGISGSGELTSPNGTAILTLSGIIDQGVESYTLVLASEIGGHGEMELAYDGPSLDLNGSFWFVDGPEPTGVLIEGVVTGDSCGDLR